MAPGFKQFAIFCQEAGIDAMSDDTVAMPTGIILESGDDKEEEDEISNDRKRRENPWTPAKSKATAEEDPRATFNVNGREAIRRPCITSTDIYQCTNFKKWRNKKVSCQSDLRTGATYRRVRPAYLQKQRKGYGGQDKKGCRQRRNPNSSPWSSICWPTWITNAGIDCAARWRESWRQRGSNTPRLTSSINALDSVMAVHLQKTSSAVKTIKGKNAFEAYTRRHGIRVKNNLADNGIFKANL